MAKKFCLIAILIGLSSLPAFAQFAGAETYQVPEAYEIYATLLTQKWPVTVAHAKNIIIRAETGTYDMCLKPEGESVAIVGPAIDNFVEVNKKTWLLEKTIPMMQPYEFIYASELKSIFSPGGPGWKGFDDKYADCGGFNIVSAVGFNADKTVAVVYISHSCGMLCGEGGFEVLQKKEGKWVELKWRGSSCSWAS